MIYITSLISIMLILFCCIKTKSNKLFFIIFIWMWILFSFSYDKADYTMYQQLYAGNLTNKVEIGFTFLCELFNDRLNIPFQVFIAIYGAIGLSLVGSTIYKYSNRRSFTAACYFIFPFIFDAIQIRNFMAMSIIIFAIRFLIRNEKLDWLKYLILNLIAISIHTFAIIGLVFLLFNFIGKKKLLFLSLIISAIEFLVLQSKAILINILSKFVSEQKIYAYFISDTYLPGISSTIKAIMIIVIMLIMVGLIYMYAKKQNKENNKFLDITIKICSMFIMFIPILFYTNMIMRLPRSMIILVYILIGNTIENGVIRGIKVKKISAYLILLLIMIIFIWIQGFIVSIGNVSITYKPLLENNYFIELFLIK